MTTKGTKGLSFPRNPSAELREMLLEQQKEPVSGVGAAGEDPVPLPEATPPTSLPESEDSALYSKHGSNLASEQRSNVGSEQGSEVARELSRKQPTQRGSKAAAERASVEAILTDLQDQPLSQLNVRVPQGINDWLDEEAHRQRKKGVTKQSLVTRAVAMLIAAQQQAGEKGSE